MKKILSLVLILAMVLSAVSALAANSKTSKDTTKTTTTNDEGDESIYLEIIEDTEESTAVIQQFKDAFAAGDVLSPLPEDIRSQIPEDRTNVNEMVTAHFVGDTENAVGSYECEIEVPSAYTAGDEVSVVIGMLDGSGAWSVFPGVVNEEGKVVVTFTADQVKAYGNDPFVLMIVSK